MTRYLLWIVSLLWFFGACRGEKADADPTVPDGGEEGVFEGVSQGGGETETTNPFGKSQKIEAGTSAVLGLVLPQRMTPEKSAPNVFRFTGNYSLPHVVGFFREQLSRSELSREGEGYLIRFGKVRRPRGVSSGEELLAIRAAKGMKGVVVDIWQEKDYKKALPETYRRSAQKRALVKSRKTVKLGQSAGEVRKKEKEETLRVMNKIAAGEKLDAKDYASPFFD